MLGVKTTKKTEFIDRRGNIRIHDSFILMSGMVRLYGDYAEENIYGGKERKTERLREVGGLRGEEVTQKGGRKIRTRTPNLKNFEAMISIYKND